MTPHQAKKIAAKALELHGFEFDKLKAQTISFADLARANALFVTAKGLRDMIPESHLPKYTRFDAAKQVCKAAGFILEAY